MAARHQGMLEENGSSWWFFMKDAYSERVGPTVPDIKHVEKIQI